MRDWQFYESARQELTRTTEVIVPPREARCFEVPAGSFFRIVSIEGPAGRRPRPVERPTTSPNASSAARRARCTPRIFRPATGCGARLPTLRPMATITHDTLDWYGLDDDGGGVHDVIGTRCDPYTTSSCPVTSTTIAAIRT